MSLKDRLCGLNSVVSATMLSVNFVGALVLAVFFYAQPGITWLRNVGWVLWWIGAVLGILPIITFKVKGGVPKGRSYMRTTELVDSGIYALVRHPQYLAWEFLALGVMFIAQHWSVVATAIWPMLFTPIDAIKADQGCVEKFGPSYEAYMQRVPGMNILAGIWRRLR